MRKVLLAATLLGIVLSSPGPAAAGTVVLGFGHFGRFGGFVGPGFVAPPVAVVPFYPAPYYPVPYGPYAYGPSYFRPDIPYGSNVERNWRDTWQDDGVKVHSYTFPGGAQ
jgi:hypothetical protein